MKDSSSIKQTAQAQALIKEEIEAVRAFRDSTVWATTGLGPLNTSDSNPYYLSLDKSASPAKWQINPGTETVNGFTRKIIFDKVSRDTSGYIQDVYNPLLDDVNTRKITVVVKSVTKTYQISTYFTNWNK
jgi:hypothetical protein